MAIFPTDKKQQNTLAVGLIALVCAFFFYFLLHKKKVAEIKSIEVEVAKLDTLVKKLQFDQQKAGIGGLQQRVAQYDQHMKRLEELIPQRADVPGLIFAIAEQAQVANVAWGSINPVLEEPVAYYSRQVYDVQVTGTYHDIGNYLAGIASLPRIIKPMDMTLVYSNTAKRRADGTPLLDAKFSIETYVIPAPGTAKPDSTKKGA